MRILLDESIPKDFGKALHTHSVSTVAECGWSGTRNGQLLALAGTAGFEVLITADRSMEFQQNLKLLPISIIIMSGRNILSALRQHIPDLLALLAVLPPRSVVRIGP